MKQKFLTGLCVLIMALLMVIQAAVLIPAWVYAIDNDEYGGIPADTLTVEVGYFGGPYYEKHVFTLDELWDMDVAYADYTFIDNMPSVIIDHVAGVRLSDMIDAAGIDLDSVQTLYFWTNDKKSSYYTTFTKASLIDTPRYVYYSLPENYDSDLGAGNDYATQGAQRVDTVMALADSWERVIAGATFGSDYLNLNTNTRFRLIYGQTDTVTRTASRSAKWVHSIVVELGGAPTITMDKSVLELEVGSVYRAEARVNASDRAISENAVLSWNSSDESVATVDEDGTVRVLREGPVRITASYGEASAMLAINDGSSSGTSDTGTENGGNDMGTAAGTGNTQESLDKQTPSPAEEAFRKSVEISVVEETGMSQAEKSIGDEGGIQNWRTKAMSETATALPDIEEENALAPVCVRGRFRSAGRVGSA